MGVIFEYRRAENRAETAARAALGGRECHHAWSEPVETHAEDDEINEEEEGPAHGMTDDLTLVPDKTAG